MKLSPKFLDSTKLQKTSLKSMEIHHKDLSPALLESAEVRFSRRCKIYLQKITGYIREIEVVD